MTNLVSVTVAAVLLVMGCSSPTTALPPDVDPEPPPSGLVPPPSSVPVPTGSAPAASDPSGAVLFRHADVELEGMLPSEVDGVQLSTYSMTAPEFVAPASEEQFAIFLDRVDGTVTDVTLAAAVDPSGQLHGYINVLRVRGADPNVLMPAMLAVLSEQSNAPTIGQTEIAGRDVSTATYSVAGDSITQYFLGQGDVIFTISGADESTVSLFMEALP